MHTHAHTELTKKADSDLFAVCVVARSRSLRHTKLKRRERGESWWPSERGREGGWGGAGVENERNKGVVGCTLFGGR